MSIAPWLMLVCALSSGCTSSRDRDGDADEKPTAANQSPAILDAEAALEADIARLELAIQELLGKHDEVLFNTIRELEEKRDAAKKQLAALRRQQPARSADKRSDSKGQPND